MKQAIEQLERAVARAEALADQVSEQNAQQLAMQSAEHDAADEPSSGSEIDPFSRDKAIAALKSLDALIGDLQKARSEA